MSLNVRERHMLRAIEARLTRADPKLAAKLGMFARLTAAERMPATERIRARGRRATRRPLGPHQTGHGQRVRGAAHKFGAARQRGHRVGGSAGLGAHHLGAVLGRGRRLAL